MSTLLANKFTPNRDLVLLDDNKARWNNVPYRRHAFHHLDEISRYCVSFRAGKTLPLYPVHDRKTSTHPKLQKMVEHPWFSAMVVVQEDRILFQEYAQDFSPHRLHSIQSITKTMVHLMVGALVEQGKIKLDAKVEDYIPEIGSGYRGISIQHVLNMDVPNDYIGNFSDPKDGYWDYEEAMGWRLDKKHPHEPTLREYVCSIENSSGKKPNGIIHYKDPNTDLLAWIIERQSQRSLNLHLADIIDAAGIEHRMVMATDRSGVPIMDGGACMTALDTARYGLIFPRLYVGEKIFSTANGGHWGAPRQIGSRDFMMQSLTPGTYWNLDDKTNWYKNQTEGDGRSIAHAGYCGQYLYANLETGKVGVYFSVAQTPSGVDEGHHIDIYEMLQHVTAL